MIIWQTLANLKYLIRFAKCNFSLQSILFSYSMQKTVIRFLINFSEPSLCVSFCRSGQGELYYIPVLMNIPNHVHVMC